MAKLLTVVVASLAVPLIAQAQSGPPGSPQVDYERDVKPILSQSCYACHGPEVQQAGLRLDARQNALRGGDYGPVIVPGKSGESKLIRRLVDGDGGLQMPPTGALLPEQIAILRAWIDQGADFRNDVAAEAPPPPIDPDLAVLIGAVRSGSRESVEPLLTANRNLVNAQDPGGSTPLHHAAGFGKLQTLALLLDAGADVNAKNRRGSTPLHWGITDASKVELLLSRGAAANVKQIEGRTPLYLAASLGDGVRSVELLLAAGADPNLALGNGRTPLMAAAAKADLETMRLLVEAKAQVDARNSAGETALMLAATAGDAHAVRYLLEHGADPRARTKRNETALGNASTAGNEETVRLLLERGAEVNVRNGRGYSPLLLAASSDAVSPAIVKLLLAHGADRDVTGDYDEAARDMSAKRGDTAVTRLLGGMPQAALSANPPSPKPSATRDVADSIERALLMLEKQSHTFIRTGGCNSCHSQDLPSAALGFARTRNLRTPREIPQLPESMRGAPDRLMDLNFVAIGGVGWELFDYGMNGMPANAYTDAAVHVIKGMQNSDGYWSSNEGRRPPMNAGELQTTALSIYALKHYTPAGGEDSSRQAIARALTWLKRATPRTTQDRAFHALGLSWADPASQAARKSARALIAQQRADGGWNQLPGMPSDAYATGQALFALAIAGQMPATDPVYQKGVRFLLGTQAADGTWLVKTRAIWLQPYFESGFPYGRDQFISTAGTAWAAMALSAAANVKAATQDQ